MWAEEDQAFLIVGYQAFGRHVVQEPIAPSARHESQVNHHPPRKTGWRCVFVNGSLLVCTVCIGRLTRPARSSTLSLSGTRRRMVWSKL